MNKIVTIVLISLSTITFAQEKKAEALLEKLDLHTGSYKNITINFDFIFKNHSLKLDESVDIGEVVQRGTIIIEGDKFQIDMDNQTIINNDSFLMAIDCENRLFKKLPVNADLKQVKSWENPINDKLIKKTIINSCSY